MSYVFQSTSYDTILFLCDAIAYEWITAGGANCTDYVGEVLNEFSDGRLAEDLLADWPTPSTDYEVAEADLEVAFQRLRRSTIERKGGRCPDCGEPAVWRECDGCGESAWIVDCGHQPQPRPLCCDESGHVMCDDCYGANGHRAKSMFRMVLDAYPSQTVMDE